MIRKMRAVFRGGAFIPQEAFALPDETVVELTVDSSLLIPPQVSDPIERQRRLHRLTQRMRTNPVPSNAPRFTREELHERR
ncbi:MAG TPA: hypothetical protein VMP01_00225 [Pirellulaceae bacterium]|nr:hypothetical protein [Pirellulaceae bacterium]